MFRIIDLHPHDDELARGVRWHFSQLDCKSLAIDCAIFVKVHPNNHDL